MGFKVDYSRLDTFADYPAPKSRTREKGHVMGYHDDGKVVRMPLAAFLRGVADYAGFVAPNGRSYISLTDEEGMEIMQFVGEPTKGSIKEAESYPQVKVRLDGRKALEAARDIFERACHSGKNGITPLTIKTFRGEALGVIYPVFNWEPV